MDGRLEVGEGVLAGYVEFEGCSTNRDYGLGNQIIPVRVPTEPGVFGPLVDEEEEHFPQLGGDSSYSLGCPDFSNQVFVVEVV